MKQQDRILLATLVILSVLTSFAFIFYSVGVISAGDAPRWEGAFAYVTAGYGLANVAVLSLAWNTRGEWVAGAHKLLALCYLGVFIMDRAKAGINSLAEVAGILILALVLRANWLAVKKVLQR